MRIRWALVVMCACGGSSTAVDRPSRDASATASESPRHVRATETLEIAGARVGIPADWWVARSGGQLTLEDPDRALRVTIAGSPARGDIRAAITEAANVAWKRGDLAFEGELDEPPPSDGWDAVASIEYTTPPSSGRAARAVWRRYRDRGYVVLIEGERAALDRRDAQIASIVGSLRPEGMREDALAGPLRALDAAKVDGFAKRALETLAVPGAAIAVIVDGRVVYERTLGVRVLGQAPQVTPDTRFLIASITKPMTTMMQAALVDAGIVRWDSPVTTLLPDFALADAAATRELRLWHMSCACTGMPRQDMEGLFEWDGVTPEARIAVMRTMKPTTKLGETFQYSNPMVAAGGFAAAHAFAPKRPLAAAYSAAMQAKIFDPIGMTSSTLELAAVERGEHARPHALALDGTTRAMPLSIERAVEPIAPAGGVWTTLRDMTKYVQTELANGVAPNGKRVVSEAAMRERTTLRVRSDDRNGYGLGIDVGTYDGLRLLSHDGGSFGFGTTMFMLPDQRVGIVILTNIRNGNAKEHLPFNAAVKRFVIEQLFAGARPLAEHQLAYFAKLRAPVRPASAPADRAWIAPLVGTYRHAVLGRVDIRATPTGGELDAGEWKTAIERVVDGDGTAQLVVLDPPFAGARFVVGNGEPPTLVVPGQTTYTFTR